MKQDSTFSMTEARGRYLLAVALMLACSALLLFFPPLFLAIAAMQGVIYRLSKPLVLAFVPAVASLVLICLYVGIIPALILTVVFFADGTIIRIAQKKYIGKNVTVAAMTAIFIVALCGAFLLILLELDKLSATGIRELFADMRTEIIETLRKQLEAMGAGAADGMDTDALMAELETTLEQTVLILPAFLTILFLLLSCAVTALYRIFCRLFQMKDGLPGRSFRLSVSMPFAVFYLFLTVLFFFANGESMLWISFLNLRLLLGFFIAIVGLNMLASSLVRFFPRISMRFLFLLLVVFVCFSTYAVLFFRIVAVVTAIRITYLAFRRHPQL